jgi:hypothetical protein
MGYHLEPLHKLTHGHNLSTWPQPFIDATLFFILFCFFGKFIKWVSGNASCHVKTEQSYTISVLLCL